MSDTTEVQRLFIPFTMLVLANIITIVIFITGELSRYTMAGAFWIFVCDAGYTALVTKFELLPRISVGTKSLLWGAHPFLWHPFTVLLAWIELYGWPNWKECVCIFIHDWGYWGCPNMEGEEGQKHPMFGALLASKWFDAKTTLTVVDDFGIPHTLRYPQEKNFRKTYYALCLLHSRTYASALNEEPSKLCWADKLSVKYDPWWFYLFRVWLSGEKDEYRREADAAGLFPLSKSDREWYEWARERMIRKALTQDARPPYQEGS